jgi:translation initiation factor IF-2
VSGWSWSGRGPASTPSGSWRPSGPTCRSRRASCSPCGSRPPATGWLRPGGSCWPVGRARPARPGGRGRSPAPDHRQPRRVRVSQPGRHRPGLRPVVRRHSPAAGDGAAAPRPGGPGHGSGHRLGRPGPVTTTVQLAGFAVTLGAIAHGSTRGASEAPEHRPDSGSAPDHHRLDVGEADRAA